MFRESISASRQIGHEVTLGRQALQVTWPLRHAISGGSDSLEQTGHSRLAFSSSSTFGVSLASPMLDCTARSDVRLKARSSETALPDEVEGVGSRELAECISGSPMSIASSAVAAEGAALEVPSPLFLGPFLCPLCGGGGDLARITGTSTISPSSSSEESASAEPSEEAPEEEDTICSLSAEEGRTCRMVDEDDEEEPDGRGPEDVLASGLALPATDFLFLTEIGLGGPGTKFFPRSLFVCAAVEAPRAFVDRVLWNRFSITWYHY